MESVVDDQQILADSLAEDNRTLRLQRAGADRPSAPTPNYYQCTALSNPARLATVPLRGPSRPTEAGQAGLIAVRHSGRFAPVGPLLGACESPAHRAGTDELSVAALTLGQSGLASTSDLSLPEDLVPSVVCSRCELRDCRADSCPRPCRLCDSAQGHEPSCLRLDFHEPTIQRFASSAEPIDESPLIGVQAVYPAGVAPTAAPEVSGAVPALPPADLELLRRVTPSLLFNLSHVKNLPRTSDGVPLQIIFDDLPVQQRLELCRLFERSQDLKHGSTIRDSARTALGELLRKCVSGFSAST